MKLSDIAPRLGRAHAQMQEAERVLGWMRDHSWTGGVDVLVECGNYVPEAGPHWVYVERVVQGDAAPYPIRGLVVLENWRQADGIPGQWAFWEVQDIRFLSERFPELLDKHPEFPRPLEQV